MSIKICSINIRGLREKIKRKAVFDFYRDRCDVLCIQETHSTEEDEIFWRNEWGGEVYYSHGTSAARGVAVLIKKSKFPCIFKTTNNVNDGRFIIGTLEYAGIKITLCTVYGPNRDAPGFFEEIFQKVISCDESKIIIIGDYNCVMDVAKDRKNSNINYTGSEEMIKYNM